MAKKYTPAREAKERIAHLCIAFTKAVLARLPANQRIKQRGKNFILDIGKVLEMQNDAKTTVQDEGGNEYLTILFEKENKKALVIQCSRTATINVLGIAGSSVVTFKTVNRHNHQKALEESKESKASPHINIRNYMDLEEKHALSDRHIAPRDFNRFRQFIIESVEKHTGITEEEIIEKLEKIYEKRAVRSQQFTALDAMESPLAQLNN